MYEGCVVASPWTRKPFVMVAHSFSPQYKQPLSARTRSSALRGTRGTLGVASPRSEWGGSLPSIDPALTGQRLGTTVNITSYKSEVDDEMKHIRRRLHAISTSTPAVFWKPNHQTFDVHISPDAVSRQGCIERYHSVWQPVGTWGSAGYQPALPRAFPIAWHDSPQLREPLKSPRLEQLEKLERSAFSSLRSDSAVLRARPRLTPFGSLIQISDSERARLFAAHELLLLRESSLSGARNPMGPSLLAPAPSV